MWLRWKCSLSHCRTRIVPQDVVGAMTLNWTPLRHSSWWTTTIIVLATLAGNVRDAIIKKYIYFGSSAARRCFICCHVIGSKAHSFLFYATPFLETATNINVATSGGDTHYKLDSTLNFKGKVKVLLQPRARLLGALGSSYLRISCIEGKMGQRRSRTSGRCSEGALAGSCGRAPPPQSASNRMWAAVACSSSSESK